MIDQSAIKLTQREVPCDAGHTQHETITVPVSLRGKHSHDFAMFPDSRALQFSFECFDLAEYVDFDGWCHGRCSLSGGVRDQGVWETFETRIAVEIFATEPPGLVLDFGANQGWYTVIAAMHGHRVIGFEAEPQIAEVCRRNIVTNGLTDRADVVVGWVDADSKRLPADEDVLFMKSDVEGAEFEVVEMCWDLFEAKRIKYALLEVSPCFRNGYGELLMSLIECGYSCHRVVNKASARRDQFGIDPIGVTTEDMHSITNPVKFCSKIRQENVLMVRR